MAVMQQIADRYYAVIPIPATGTFAPGRNSTDGDMTAGALVISPVDGNGNALGTSANPLVVSSTGAAPASTPVANSSGQKANAAATATMPAVAGKTNYVTGFDITSDGATAAAVVLAALTGVVGGGLNYVYSAVAGASAADQSLFVRFSPPIPASAANTAVSLTLPALGAGNTAAVVNLFGYVM